MKKKFLLLSIMLCVTLFLLTSFSLYSAPTDIVYYYNKNQAFHQAKFDELYKKKYRVISLSVSGSTNDPRFSCIWIKDDQWQPFHVFSTRNAAGYQAKFDEWVSKGFVPNIISVTGDSPNNSIFAGTFIKKTEGVPYTRTRQTKEEFQATINLARENDLIPVWLNAYGNSKKKYYASIWRKNTEKTYWTGNYDQSIDKLQERYLAHKYIRARPAFMAVEPGNKILACFQNDEIGSFGYYNNLNEDGLIDKIDDYKKNGFFPIKIDAYGTGNNTRYTVQLAKRITSLKKEFKKSGQNVPFTKKIDEEVQRLMEAENIKTATVAISFKGRLIHARGYTYAEKDYPVTQPNDRFRMASIAKSLSAIAIFKEIEKSNGTLSLNTKLEDILGIRFRDPRFNQVTLGHALTHSSGLEGRLAKFSEVSDDFNNGQYPISADLILQWNANQLDLFVENQLPSGSSFNYCNKGFFLMGQALAKINPQQSYEQKMRKWVFDPLGLPNAKLSTFERRKGEVLYQHQRLRLDKSLRGDGKLVSVAYQAVPYETWEAMGGWALTAPELIKVLSSFHSNVDNPLLKQATINQMWMTGNPNNTGFGWTIQTKNIGNKRIRTVSKGGVHTNFLVSRAVIRRDDDVSMVLVFNKKISRQQLDVIENAIHRLANETAPADWPDHDLFPSFGIPAF